MFSIEHEFDCTVITILDEGSKQLTEDISVTNFEECTTLEQYDPVNAVSYTHLTLPTKA